MKKRTIAKIDPKAESHGSNGHGLGLADRPGLLRPDEAAEYLECSIYTLLRWTKLGKIEHVRSGKMYVRYTKAGLDRFIAKRTVVPER